MTFPKSIYSSKARQTRLSATLKSSRFHRIGDRFVAPLRPHFQITPAIGKLDIDAPIAAIVLIVGWFVSQEVLGPQLFGDFGKRALQCKHVAREKRRSPRLLSQLHQIAIFRVLDLPHLHAGTALENPALVEIAKTVVSVRWAISTASKRFARL